jgi:hypothetical protein
MCVCLEHSVRQTPDPGRCWQLTTPRLIGINGSLGADGPIGGQL